MVFNAVLAEAFRGCGTSLSAVRRSSAYRRTLREQRALADRMREERSVLGSAYRAGHFAFGRACNPWSSYSHSELRQRLTECDSMPSNLRAVEQRALLLHFSQQLIRAARVYSAPRRFHRWAREWRAANTAEEQMEIAQRVCSCLKSQQKASMSPSMHADMLNQPRARVLPAFYGRWHERKQEKANCVGKAQLLAAFFSLCGAKTMSVLPILTAEEYRTELYGSTAERLLSLFNTSDSEERAAVSMNRMMLELYAERIRDQREQPSWPHLALAVKLVGGRWALLDPNFSVLTRIPGELQTQRVFDFLERYREVLPGTSISRTLSERHDAFDIPLVDDFVCEMERFMDRRHSTVRPLRGERVFRAIEKCRLDTLFFHFIQQHRKRSPEGSRPDRREESSEPYHNAVAVLLLQYLVAQSSESLPELEAWTHEKIWQCISSGEARKLLRGEATDRAVERFLLHAAREALGHVCWRGKNLSTRSQMHQQCELGNTGYQIALHTLSHVGVDMGIGDETTAVLLQHGYGQFLLHNSASLVARQPDTFKAVNPLAEDAAEHLAELPFKLRSSLFLLKEYSDGKTA